MHSLCYCLGAVSMTLTVILFLLPNFALGHLGAALRTGSGTLTKFAFGDNVIYCTFTNLGDGKPSILSHVRVSREPQSHQSVLLKKHGFEGAGDHLLQTSKIKSPSYQHKILQFHGNGQTSSSGYDFMPLKLISNQYSSTKSMPIYPVASKFGKVDTRRLGTLKGSWDYDDDGDGDSWERYSNKWEPNLLPKSEEPTFTPYIGARALANLPQFFQHLRENIHAIYEKQHDSAANSEERGEPVSTSLLSSNREEEDDANKSSENQDIKIATPTRRGYSSNSEPTLSQDDDDERAGDEDMKNRDSRASDLYTLGSQISKESVNGGVPDRTTKELLRFLGHGRQEYSKANNYNPAWLFTNLGLGKRSGSSEGSSSKSNSSFDNH